jgi:hypothetical protein
MSTIKANRYENTATTAGGLDIDSSGRIGVGSSSPTTTVDVNASQAFLQLKSTGGTNSAGIQLVPGGQSQAFYIYNNGSRNLIFEDHATERLRILSDGTIATGGLTATPGTVAAGSYIQHAANAGFFGNNGDAKFGSSANNPVLFQVNGSEKARIDTSGNVFIGGTTASNSDIALNADGSASFASGNFAFDSGGVISTNIQSAGHIELDSSGSFSSPKVKLFANTGNATFGSFDDSSNSGFGAKINVTTNSSDVRTQCISTASQYTQLYGAYFGSAVSFYVLASGNVFNLNNSYGAISDIKLKENIVDASSQWDDIKDIRVRNYNFIEGQTHTQLGVVAQEVETVSPGLVADSPDTDNEGNDLGTTTKSVNYSVLYMKAVKALQEAMTRIETLEQRLSDAGIA